MPASELLGQLLEAHLKGGGPIHAHHGDFSDIGKDKTSITYGVRPAAAMPDPSGQALEQSAAAMAAGLDISYTHFGQVGGNNVSLDIRDVKDLDPQALQQIVHPGSASTNSRSPLNTYNSQEPSSTMALPRTQHLSDGLGSDREKLREKRLDSLNKKS